MVLLYEENVPEVAVGLSPALLIASGRRHGHFGDGRLELSNDRVDHSFITSTKYLLPPSPSRQKLDSRQLATDLVFDKVQC